MRPHPAFLVIVVYMRSRGSNIGPHACAGKFYPKSHLHRFPIVSFDCHFTNRAHDIVLKAKTKHTKMKPKSLYPRKCFDKKAELTMKENSKWQPKWLNCRVIIWCMVFDSNFKESVKKENIRGDMNNLEPITSFEKWVQHSWAVKWMQVDLCWNKLLCAISDDLEIL